MSKTIITILAASMTLAALPLVWAEPGAEDADCEQTYWTGYTTTESARQTYNSLRDPSDPYMNNCEGEHWDGGDSVAPGNNPGTSSGCGTQVQGTSVARCMNADPNEGSASATSGNGQPVVFRVSLDGTEAYIALDIGLVGRVAVYQGACQTGSAMEYDSSCAGSAATRTGVYLRDNTDQATGGTDVLATIVSAAGITKGHAENADCDQATYQQGATSNPVNRDLCGRDNTAITVQTVLP